MSQPGPSAGVLFPQTDRVIYSKAPLVQVTCGLRFPTILRIKNNPADFQERIRAKFPLLEAHAALPPDMPQMPPEVLKALAAQVGTDGYVFLTEDRSANIVLTPGSLIVTTEAYTRWENFRAIIDMAAKALIEIYKPSFYSRAGLRYMNAIDRAQLGLKANWSDLLSKAVLAELAESP
ncbi:MAG: TIGR04255 family protein, partial [Fimbriimonadaceae bacterium]